MTCGGTSLIWWNVAWSDTGDDSLGTNNVCITPGKSVNVLNSLTVVCLLYLSNKHVCKIEAPEVQNSLVCSFVGLFAFCFSFLVSSTASFNMKNGLISEYQLWNENSVSISKFGGIFSWSWGKNIETLNHFKFSLEMFSKSKDNHWFFP